MPSDEQALLLQMSADIRALEKSFDRAAGIVDSGSKRIERRAGLMVSTIERSFGGVKLPKNLAREYDQLGHDIAISMGNASRAAQLALAGVSFFAIRLAMDAAEVENAFDVAFKGASANARQFSEILANEVGRDAVELRQAMTRLQLVLTGTGVAAEQAAEMVKRLTQLGVDAGSLFNVSDAEALQKIISGLTGETEPLKAFGVVVNETAVKAELLRLGFKGNAEQASEAAKSVARANVIMRGLAVAQGDAAKTADSAANQAKAMRAEFNKAARELGEQLIPAFIKVAGATRDVLREFNELPDGVQLAGLAILAFIAAGGPIAGLLANLGRVIKLAKETRAALAAIGTASAGAGAASAAGGAAGAGALAARGLGFAAGGPILGTAAVGGGLVLSGAQYNRTVAAVQDASDAALQAAIDTAKAQIDAYDGSKAGRRRFEKLQSDLSKLMFEKLRRDAGVAGAESATGAQNPTDVAGGFTLGGDLLKPVPGSTKPTRDVSDERTAQVAAQVAATEHDLLRARLDLAVGAEERAALEREIVGKVAAQEEARLRAQLAALQDAKGLDAATKERLSRELQALQLKNQEILQLQEQAIAREAADRAARDRLELSLQDLDGEAELLALQASLATTAKARRELELRLLDLADQRLTAELQAVLASKTASDAEKELARRRLAQLQESRPAREAVVREQTAGPIESYLKSIKDLDTFIEAEAVHAFQQLTDSLGDSAAKALGLKGALGQLVGQLISMLAQRGGAGFLGSLSGFLSKLPGFASGTDSAPGGWARINERGAEGLAFLPKGTKVIPNDVLRALSQMSVQPAAPRAVEFRMSIDLTGANGDQTIRRIAYQAAFEGATAARQAAVADVQRQQARRAMRTLR